VSEIIYCNGEKTRAIKFNELYWCDRCGKQVKVVVTSTPTGMVLYEAPTSVLSDGDES